MKLPCKCEGGPTRGLELNICSLCGGYIGPQHRGKYAALVTENDVKGVVWSIPSESRTEKPHKLNEGGSSAGTDTHLPHEGNGDE